MIRDITSVGYRQNPSDLGWAEPQEQHFPRYRSEFPTALARAHVRLCRWRTATPAMGIAHGRRWPGPD